VITLEAIAQVVAIAAITVGFWSLWPAFFDLLRGPDRKPPRRDDD
jgi:hypothetical protein